MNNSLDVFIIIFILFLFIAIYYMDNISLLLNKINVLHNRIENIQQLTKSIDNLPRYKIINNVKMSVNAINVLDSAFGEKYDNDKNYTNAYDLHNGTKGMDWWNFPWDLPSSQMQYTITYEDMKDILDNVVVKMNKDDIYYVKYSEKLNDMVQQLTPKIMMNHGGYLRVRKIIYCIRNFMSVAIKYNLVEDMNNLMPAINKLLSFNINEVGMDVDTLNNGVSGKNIDNMSENRTITNGFIELEQLKNVVIHHQYQYQ